MKYVAMLSIVVAFGFISSSFFNRRRLIKMASAKVAEKWSAKGTLTEDDRKAIKRWVMARIDKDPEALHKLINSK